MSRNLFTMAAEAASIGVVKLDQDLRRIEALPRRSWRQGVDRLCADLTDVLRRPGGSMSLRPVQAAALFDVGVLRGLFAPIRVGAGKTLISLLASKVVEAERPLLLVPAALVDKTHRDYDVLNRHWALPELPRILSYEWLGRVQAADVLQDYEPDLIVADEAHRLKNPKAAVTRRVKRYMAEHRDTVFVAMSGTITKRSINDYAHLLRWTHAPHDVPLPGSYQALELWADALDERKGQLRRADPGALQVLCNEEENKLWRLDRRTAARRAYRRRLVETPGVVATYETPIDASILVRAITPPAPERVEQAFARLRQAWETPDGWPIADGLGVFQHARELGLGFYYVWDPRPPADWLQARKDWCAYVRRTLSRSRTLDSELQVRSWVEQEKPRDGIEYLSTWLSVRDSFEPKTRAEWLDDFALEACLEWAHANRGIVWVEHRCFGQRLADFGLAYYGGKGLSRSGKTIEQHDRTVSLAASIASNSTGRNLQAWRKNLISSMPANGLQTEQLMGRTHRDGQIADEVRFDVLMTCAEHVGALWQAVSDSRYVQDSTGSPQKLLLADLDVPSADSLALLEGHRWNKSTKRK